MKYLFFILILVSCYFDTPKFKIGDKVRFKLPYEYYYACKNIGIIHNIIFTVSGKATYYLEPIKIDYRYNECPDRLVLFESDVWKYESILREDLPYE